MSTHLNAITFPSLAPEQEDRDAGEEAGEETTEETALAQVLGVAVDETRGTKCAAAA